MGVFDRKSAGHISAPIIVTLERGAMISFAEAIGETDPVHSDPAAARAAGHADILAPLTYATVVATLADHTARRRGMMDTLDRINADYRYVLHGNENYTYHGAMFASDEVIVTTEIKGFSDAKGGKLEIAHLSQSIAHPDRGLLVAVSRDVLHRLERSTGA